MFHKLAFCWDMGRLVILFCKLNTTPFVIWDNSSTLTILDLSLAHYSFHPIVPQNWQISPFLLPLWVFFQ